MDVILALEMAKSSYVLKMKSLVRLLIDNNIYRDRNLEGRTKEAHDETEETTLDTINIEK